MADIFRIKRACSFYFREEVLFLNAMKKTKHNFYFMSAVRRLSSVLSVVCRPLSVVRRLSSVVRCLSSVVCRPSSVLCRPSSVVCLRRKPPVGGITTSHEPRATNHEPRTTNYAKQTQFPKCPNGRKLSKNND